MPATVPSPPLDTTQLDWIPLRPGLSFKPLVYFADHRGWQLLLKVEPGTTVPLHRHSGEIHAFNLAGFRRLDSGDLVGPGGYVFEPAGNVDSWQAVGEEPCILHIEVNGRIEYLDAAGEVAFVADAAGSRSSYLGWCAAQGRPIHPAFQNEP